MAFVTETLVGMCNPNPSWYVFITQTLKGDVFLASGNHSSALQYFLLAGALHSTLFTGAVGSKHGAVGSSSYIAALNASVAGWGHKDSLRNFPLLDERLHNHIFFFEYVSSYSIIMILTLRHSRAFLNSYNM